MITGWDAETTNNRMELLAVITALEALKRPCSVAVYSDSKYVLDGITRWIKGWQKRNWKKVKNVDLWKRMLEAVEGHSIDWNWVRGHSGDPGNERADQLASAAAEIQGHPME